MGERKDTVVGGLGNPLMTDEGAGLYVVRRLMATSEQFNSVDFVELGSSLMNVVHAIAGRRRAVLIDCACMAEPPGTIRRFGPGEVVSRKDLAHFSLHEGDLLDALELSSKLGECPAEVIIFGIQPESMAPGDGLSSSLQQRLESYVRLVKAELEESEVH